MKQAKTIGVLGGGQLGQMLGMAAIPLGFRCIFYEKNAPVTKLNKKVNMEQEQPCAAAVGSIYSNFNSFANSTNLFTYEFENVSLKQAYKLAYSTKGKLYPSIKALNISSNRYFEKQLFKSLGVSSHNWLPIRKADELSAAAKQLKFPFLVKTCSLGYDGKGQTLIKNACELKKAQKDLFASEAANEYIKKFRAKVKEDKTWINISMQSGLIKPFRLAAKKNEQTNSSPAPYIAEEFVPLKRELSLISVRSIKGKILHYPIAENEHRNGILHLTRAPAKVGAKQTQQLHSWMEKLLKGLSYVGILTLEVFDSSQGLLANEIAPRVHNSGHWTIEGAETSQFENHIRAISGMPLGSAEARGFSIMLNLVGKLPKKEAKTTGHLHLYGKEPKAGRKIGHITWTAPTKLSVAKQAAS